jgi:phosphoribosylaminoimidazole-succinocarboxamide synthase
MQKGLKETHFQLPNQRAFYRGKVRDVYTCDDKLVMVATDRISAFDVVLEKPIPYKGQVLNQLAAHFLRATSDIVPNWLLDTPDPNVSVGLRCQPFAVEMVIRGYLAGHSWREYRAGKRTLCGVNLPEGLNENDRLPVPIITPTTKAVEGHDEDISKEEIIQKGIVSPEHYTLLETYTYALFARGTRMAKDRGLILVDTKYEFGLYNGEIYLIDEIHTPDSSRYFYLEGYEERQEKGEPQKQLSKEFVRQWLIERGFQGKEGQNQPEMTQEWLEKFSQRYIELYEQVSGEKFNQSPYDSVLDRIEHNILRYLNSKKA